MLHVPDIWRVVVVQLYTNMELHANPLLLEVTMYYVLLCRITRNYIRLLEITMPLLLINIQSPNSLIVCYLRCTYTWGSIFEIDVGREVNIVTRVTANVCGDRLVCVCVCVCVWWACEHKVNGGRTLRHREHALYYSSDKLLLWHELHSNNRGKDMSPSHKISGAFSRNVLPS